MTNPTFHPHEVRRCGKCDDASVVLVFEWRHSVNGVQTGVSTRDYRCQACGQTFTIHPKFGSWTLIVAGVLSCAGLPLAFWGWWRLTQDRRHPVVPGAPRPRMRYPVGPPRRRCASCGRAVALTAVIRRASNGLPTGTEYEYACVPCKKDFVIESAWGHAFAAMASLLLLGVAWAFFTTASSAGWKWGGALGGLALSTFLIAQLGVRVSNRFRYPEVD